MKKFMLAAAAALMLAACGGSHPASRPVIKPPLHTPKAAVVKAKVVNQHVCDPRDYTLACPLPPAPVSQIVRGVDPVTQGIDFGWSSVSASLARSLGASFGASYLSTDTSKNWTRSAVTAYHSLGLGTVAVWETSATRATAGCAAGASDARAASGQLANLGYPGSHFDMAIDFDATGPQVINYFRCANQAEPGKVGAYGGYRPLQYLCAQHVITLGWQTYAWSGGLWLPASCAPLEQYLNGSSFDHDRAIATNYGQFPAPVLKPKVPLCSRSMCYKRFADVTFTNNGYHSPTWGVAGVCSHGCREATLIGDWQHSKSVCISVATCSPQHSYRLWVRYRIQWLERRLAYVSAHSTAAVNKKLNRPQRKHILWAIGYQAAYRTNYNAYLKVTG